jgi:hypothetical protein
MAVYYTQPNKVTNSIFRCIRIAARRLKLFGLFRLPFTWEGRDNCDLDLLRVIDDANHGRIRSTLT